MKYYKIISCDSNKQYIHEIHGSTYVSWVDEKYKTHAHNFSEINVNNWKKILEDFTNRHLDIEEVK